MLDHSKFKDVLRQEMDSRGLTREEIELFVEGAEFAYGLSVLASHHQMLPKLPTGHSVQHDTLSERLKDSP